MNEYLSCCVQIQPKFLRASPSEDRLAENDEEIVQLFLNCVYQFANFAKGHLPIFKFLKLSDQQILLRTSIIELCFLRAAFCYEQGVFYRTILSRSFPNGVEQHQSHRPPDCCQFSQESNDQFGHRHQSNRFSQNDLQTGPFQFANGQLEQLENTEYRFGKAPVLTRCSLESFLGEQLSNKFFAFVKQIQECNLDEAMVLLVALVVLLNPERNQLIDCKRITDEQESYLDLLERYMQWKSLSGSLFAKLLINLTNLRELGELFAEFQLENNVLDRFSGRFEQTDCSDYLESDYGRLAEPLPRMFTIKSLTN